MHSKHGARELWNGRGRAGLQVLGGYSIWGSRSKGYVCMVSDAALHAAVGYVCMHLEGCLPHTCGFGSPTKRSMLASTNGNTSIPLQVRPPNRRFEDFGVPVAAGPSRLGFWEIWISIYGSPAKVAYGTNMENDDVIMARVP